MKISTSWIKEYTDLPNNKKDLYNLLDKFAQQCIDIDQIIEYGEGLDDIFVSKIKKIINHPNAEKLKIVEAEIDNENLQIVTGAPNIYVGMICPLIKSGGKLPNGMIIEKKSLRGIDSNGMLCSEKELGIGNDHTGIMDLGEYYSKHIGEKISKIFSDTIIEIDNKIISNRPDLFSHRGIAREFFALTKTKIYFDKEDKLDINIDKNFKVSILDKDFCTRYLGIIIKNVEIKESPVWLSQKLNRVGVNSINNIVDATNYIMLDIGQPLHAFDLDKIGGDKSEIIVRKAKSDEIIETLDSKRRILTEENYVIANNNRAIGIAGIMGGKDSEVDDNTKNIFLESATFDPIKTRKSSKSVKIKTDASIRYEKNLSQKFAYEGILKAISLIKDVSCGEEGSNLIDIISKKEKLNNEISLDIKKVKQILGIDIDKKEILEILKNLNMEVSVKSDILNILPPQERKDIKEDVDIIEEIGRIYGYNNIPVRLPVYESSEIIPNPLYEIEKKLRTIVAASGGYEIKTYSFINEYLLKQSNYELGNSIKIINPISDEFTHLRQTLVPSMLKTVNLNAKNYDYFRLFEIANTYFKTKEELPDEKLNLCISIYSKNKEIGTFFELKNIIDNIKEYLNLSEDFNYVKESNSEEAIKTQSASIYLSDTLIGNITNVHPQIKDNFNIIGNLSICNLNIDLLLKYINKNRLYKAISQYQEITEDLNVVYNKKFYNSSQILSLINDDNIREKYIIDIYEGKPLKENEISLTVRLKFQNFERTFRSEEIKDKMANIKETICKNNKGIYFR